MAGRLLFKVQESSWDVDKPTGNCHWLMIKIHVHLGLKVMKVRA
jgi:hypothetical protein